MPNPVGRPRKYTNAADMQEGIDKYFEECQTPTLSGLALALGFADRHSLNEYEQVEIFSTTIKQARARISQKVEERVIYSKDGQAGGIFYLKNLQFTDKVEHDIQGKIEETKNVNININAPMHLLEDLSKMQAKEALEVIEMEEDDDTDTEN